MFKKIYFIMIITTFLFSQHNIWGGNSVATSDNLDVFTLNPRHEENPDHDQDEAEGD